MSDLLIANDTLGVVKLHTMTQMLNELAHPSVVAIEHSQFTDIYGELELVPVNGVSLADAGLDLESLIQAIASAAAGLVHVHDHDVAVVDITADSLFTRSDNSVVLTNFVSAKEDANAADKQGDVQQLAAIARTLIPEVDVLRERMNGDDTSKSRASFIALLDEADKGGLDARLFAEKLRHSLWFDFKPAKEKAKHRRSWSIPNFARLRGGRPRVANCSSFRV